MQHHLHDVHVFDIEDTAPIEMSPEVRGKDEFGWPESQLASFAMFHDPKKQSQ